MHIRMLVLRSIIKSKIVWYFQKYNSITMLSVFCAGDV